MYNYGQHLHFVGIGGVGMAGIAEVLLNLGYAISGSDLKSSSLIDHLSDLGAHIHFGHRSANLPDETTVVVVSSAIGAENPEVQLARSRGIPVIPRAEMLAELMRMKYGVAVAGSHGKTTTTSMTAKILTDAGLDPTVIIGGRVLSQQSGAKLGTGQYLVAEADESDGSFCLLKPAVAIVTNIDAEHMGHYGSFGALEHSFAQFMSSVPFYGLVVACFDDPVVARLASGLQRRVVSYGLSPEHEVYAKDIVIDGPITKFTLCIKGRQICDCALPMLGVHMVSNALAAIAVGIELGVYPEEACLALECFPGVSRRTEVVCNSGGILVLDDYAHHPREISATLTAVRRGWLPYMSKHISGNPMSQQLGRLVVIFQPHRYSRTKELFTEFLSCFSEADEVIIGNVYSAGEEEIPGINGRTLAAAMQHSNVSFVSDLSDVVQGLVSKVKPGDVIVTIGAGSVGQVSQQLARALND